MLTLRTLLMIMLTFVFSHALFAQWPEPKAPAIPEADGYVVIPNAAVPPDKNHVYKAIFDATRSAGEPTDLLPAINNAGSELNAFSVAGIPKERAKLAVVFHGAALDGILDDTHYRAKFGVTNPNLKVLSKLKEEGVELFVCGQNLAAAKIDPKSLAPEVTVASDALIVLMQYQNSGYALISY